jgi:hypothetical protein
LKQLRFRRDNEGGYQIHKKGVTVGIILVFIGVAVAPSFNVSVVKASDDNELMDVTTHICGISGDSTFTVRLTQQQIQEVKTVFDALQNRLSTVKSMEETWRIFNDTIVSLSGHNLLPAGMSIEHAERLVRSSSQNQKGVPFLQKLSPKFRGDSNAGEVQNSFCSIAGNTSNVHFLKPVGKLALNIFEIYAHSTGNIILALLCYPFWVVFYELNIMSQMVLKREGRHIGVSIFFGNYHYAPYPNWFSPAQGWLSTNGINGIQNISGSFWGQRMTSGWQPEDDWHMNYSWRGCMGFTGLLIYLSPDSAYYLGSALSINVGPNRPKAP